MKDTPPVTPWTLLREWRSGVRASTSPTTAREVEQRGRFLQVANSFAVLCGCAVGIGSLVLELRIVSNAQLPRAAGTVLISAVTCVALAGAVRWLGWYALSSSSSSSTGTGTSAGPPAGPPSGTVICCSGGGIKSASFCIGALQRLDSEGAYDTAETVVGVSGGGYAAAAFAVAKTKQPEGRRSFSVASNDLATLRRRTNYLASSRRVRFEFFSSFALGIALNLVIVISGGALLGWLVAGYGRAAGLVTHLGSREWTDGTGRVWSGSVALPVLLFAAAAVLFLVDRLRPDSSGSFPRWSSLSPVSWWSNLPNSLVALGTAWLLFGPGLLWTAELLHNTLQTHQSLGALRSDVGKVLALMFGTGAYAALTRSAIKGLQQESGQTSFWGGLLKTARTSIAPRLALWLLFAGVYAAEAVYVSYELAPMPEGRGANWLGVPAAAAVGLLIARVLGTANRTSMHPFYRNRLSWAYLGYGTEGDARAYNRTFDDLSRDSPAKPTLTLCATANIENDDVLPTGRNGAQFIFSSGQTGMPDRRLFAGGQNLSMQSYEKHLRTALAVSEAVAISGAAVAPVAGRDTKMYAPYRVLLALANIRLGVWLPNPYWALLHGDETGWRRAALAVNRLLDVPSPLKVLEEAFGQLSIYSSHLYVTDGGHYDNLGIVEALRRRPARIIMLDGSGDAEDKFPTMGRAIATARMDLDVEVTFDPTPMCRGTKEFAASGSAVAHAIYGDGEVCHIDYVKCVMPEGMTWDLSAYKMAHPDFPATSTSLEMYDEFDFEAYRQLGYLLVQQAEASWSPAARCTFGDLRHRGGRRRTRRGTGKHGPQPRDSA